MVRTLLRTPLLKWIPRGPYRNGSQTDTRMCPQALTYYAYTYLYVYYLGRGSPSFPQGQQTDSPPGRPSSPCVIVPKARTYTKSLPGCSIYTATLPLPPHSCMVWRRKRRGNLISRISVWLSLLSLSQFLLPWGVGDILLLILIHVAAARMPGKQIYRPSWDIGLMGLEKKGVLAHTYIAFAALTTL